MFLQLINRLECDCVYLCFDGHGLRNSVWKQVLVVYCNFCLSCVKTSLLFDVCNGNDI